MTGTYVIRPYPKIEANYRMTSIIARVNLRLKGYRLCHNKSARKHRRRGDEVRYVNEGWYAWRRRSR